MHNQVARRRQSQINMDRVALPSWQILQPSLAKKLQNLP